MERHPRSILWYCLAAWLVATLVARADWTADSGYPQLQVELGGNLPTGAGITVFQSEAGYGGDASSFMPQASATTPFGGSGNYSGKTFTIDLPSTPGNYSSHADVVATHYYGNSGSVAPGVTDVHVMAAQDFYDGIIDSAGAHHFTGSVQNHSWIAGDTGDNPYVLRAFDFMIDRDSVVVSVPLDNSTGPVPVLLANSYHAISVGLRNGLHSRGGSTEDGTGRMKPDLVVNESQTSFASPAVASTATMLLQTVNASFPTANHPQVMKAILLAAASKANLPVWHRPASTAPYDSTFGAGELNVFNAYHDLAKGGQSASTSTERTDGGWDFGSVKSSTAKRYFFSIPQGSLANTFSAALTWHRSINFISGNYTSSLPHLTLKLYASNNFTVGTVIDQSNSTLDNVQHVFQYNLPAGQYALEVSTTSGSSVAYGFAWQSIRGNGPSILASVHPDATVWLDLARLDPYVTYTIQQSSDLIHWSNATTVLTSSGTASTTASWQDNSASPSTPKFYRLQWTAVR
jgi:hypothetical protein